MQYTIGRMDKTQREGERGKETKKMEGMMLDTTEETGEPKGRRPPRRKYGLLMHGRLQGINKRMLK